MKYYHNPDRLLDKMAFSLTGDMGCEHGGGVSCTGDSAKGPKQSFLGYMLYNRLWFHKDLYGVTLGGGQINNPGRYLVLLPPINGATAALGYAVLHGESGRSVQGMGCFGHVRLHAQSVHYVPHGVRPPACECALLLRTGRSHAAGRKHRIARFDGDRVGTPDLVQTQNTILGAILVMF